jgi:hypothetical protein
MKSITMCFILLFCIFGLFECSNDHTSKKHIAFDPEPIIKLAIYDRYLADPFNLKRPDDIKGLLQQADTIKLKSLALTAYNFEWSKGPGGKMNRILCFCRDTGVFFQREFAYVGEYKMSLDNDYGPNESGNNTALGLQLSQLALEMGPSLYFDAQKMRTLLISTMEKALKCPRIDQASLNELDSARWTHFFNYADGFIKDTSSCIKNFKKIRNEIEQKNPNVFYFQGELFNGIWRGQIQKFEHKNQYWIELDYLNGACAFTLRM